MSEKKVVRTLKYLTPEQMAEYRAEYEAGAGEAVDVGRSGWDMVHDFSAWVRSIARWIALGVLGVVLYAVFGWVAVVAFVCGMPCAWVIGNIFLHGRYEFVDVHGDDLHWDTWEIGVQKFHSLRHEGSISPVSSSRGNIRYLCEKLDLEKGVMVSSWVGGLSSFEYLMDMRAFKRVVKLFSEMLDEMLDTIGFSSVLGKIKASEILKAFIGDYDKSLKSLKPDYDRVPVNVHDIVKQPMDDVIRDETPSGHVPEMEVDS